MSSRGAQLIEEASRLRERALALRSGALQTRPDNPELDEATFEEVMQLLERANEMEQRGLLDEEGAAGAAPATDDPEASPAANTPLATAAFLAAGVLPGGMLLGSAALAVGPHLGVDVGVGLGLGSASARARATLVRGGDGSFGLELGEYAGGVIIVSLRESDADDDRSRLQEGDFLFAVDGVAVARPSRGASEAADAAADDADAATPPRAAGAAGAQPLALGGVESLLRGAERSATIEVWRTEVRPLRERLHECDAVARGEVERLRQSVSELASPHLESAGVLPHLQRASDGLDQLAGRVRQTVHQAAESEQGKMVQRQLEQLGQQAQQLGQQVQQQVQQQSSGGLDGLASRAEHAQEQLVLAALRVQQQVQRTVDAYVDDDILY